MKKFCIILAIMIFNQPVFADNKFQMQLEQEQRQSFDKVMNSQEGKYLFQFMFVVLLVKEDYSIGENTDSIYNRILLSKEKYKNDKINTKYINQFLNLYKKYVELQNFDKDAREELKRYKIYISDEEYNKIDKFILDIIITLNCVL